MIRLMSQIAVTIETRYAFIFCVNANAVNANR